MINLDYPQLLDQFDREIRAPNRSESASFLIWYLQKYYRLDVLEATDAVCDQTNDRGVDGIFVNDNDKTITVFQSKISQSKDKGIGDKPLREFAGTLTQFASTVAVNNLANVAAPQLSKLIKRLDLAAKIATYELRGEFLSNVNLYPNGTEFLKTTSNIRFVGNRVLKTTYISDERDLPVHKAVAFDTLGFNVTEYAVDANVKAVIAPVKATELVRMEGIANQSLFAFNVRGPLGGTGVNKKIRASVQDKTLHKFFPLFHNGITVVAGQVDVTEGSITVSDYFVVNGCQSLSALYADADVLTDDLRVLTKFIRLEPTSPWVKKVTEFSNTQNGVRERDFMANDSTQVRLQNEFRKLYAEEYAFEIKRGDARDPGRLISNEIAGLLLMAFDLKEPWATHRKYQVFDDKYSQIFGRPEVTADRIVMCQVIFDAVVEALPAIKNQLVAKYALTRYALVYMVRNILEADKMFYEITTNPQTFVRDPNDRERFLSCIRGIVGDVVEDLNSEVEEYGEDFDYRDKMRDEKWVKDLTKTIVTDHAKLIRRGKIQTFSEEWEKGSKAT